ncbi:MAG: UDP-N-acetylmuramoyl-tripeptide--D-alanyl-D-alanine ligase, partial [Chitinophagaceae bacterium]
INDCYNANPDSMRAALRTLGAISGQIQKFAVIGNMAELGDQESELHRGLVKEIEEAHITQTFTIGKLAKHTFDALEENGKPAAHFETKTELAEALKKMAKKGDVVLVKGSRSAALEEVTELLLKD